MTERIWLTSYPEGVPADIDANCYASLAALIEESFQKYATRPLCTFMGHTTTYADADVRSHALAAWLQTLGLAAGARVALMMPNVPQYPIALAAVLRAGFVAVNVNPLYTAPELEHQLADSGAEAIIVLENFAATLQTGIARTAVKHVLVTALGDELGFPRSALVNFAVRHIKKMVPAYHLPAAVGWKTATARGRSAPFHAPSVNPDDLALLQYTGGTTGVPKGAMLLHRNIVANILQSEAWYQPAMKTIPAGEQPTTVCALPLYHIFSFTICLMLMLRTGGRLLLIPNPRDLKATLKTLHGETFHSFPGVNTLFNALANHPDFHTVDWSHLRISVGGGSAVQRATAKLWLEKTGSPICEGYGLSETSPSVACNPVTSREFNGTIGVPLPGTWIKLIDEQDMEVPAGTRGQIAIRGPQVMAGYWQRPDETAKVMTADGYFKSGDIGVMDEHGVIRIVDRLKDMILVSGFNVYPNEVEDVLAAMPGVREVGVIGIPDERSGEAVKAVIVRKDPALTEDAVRAYCRDNLTGYKRPKVIEFRAELPKSPVGKVLRRQLRD